MRIIVFFFLLLVNFQTYGQKKSIKKYNSFNQFYERLSNSGSLKFTSLLINDTVTQTELVSDSLVKKVFLLKIAEYELSFVTLNKIKDIGGDSKKSYILFNKQKILLDSSIDFEDLRIQKISRATLNGTIYLVLTCSILDCNGTSCRIEFSQLFYLDGKSVKYQIIEGFQSPQNIFCDLNNDGQLDLISFVGDCSLQNRNLRERRMGKTFFCVEALTLEKDKWIALLDKHKNPFYIYFEVDDFFELDTFKLIKFNWLTSL